MRQAALRAAGHFRLLVDHSLRPYEPSPSHMLKRMLLPLCEDVKYVLAEGTKNDAWELLTALSEACQRLSKERRT